MTRMQAARVFAKRRAFYRMKAARAADCDLWERHDRFAFAAEAVEETWFRLKAAWDSEELAHNARKGKE